VSVCISVHLFAGQSNIMPRRRANVGRRTRRAERATATRGRVQLVTNKAKHFTRICFHSVTNWLMFLVVLSTATGSMQRCSVISERK
jgi:hypothetical protein